MLPRGAYVSLLFWSMLHVSLASLQQLPYESLSDYGLTSLRAQTFVNGSSMGISPEIGALSTTSRPLALIACSLAAHWLPAQVASARVTCWDSRAGTGLWRTLSAGQTPLRCTRPAPAASRSDSFRSTLTCCIVLWKAIQHSGFALLLCHSLPSWARCLGGIQSTCAAHFGRSLHGARAEVDCSRLLSLWLKADTHGSVDVQCQSATRCSSS